MKAIEYRKKLDQIIELAKDASTGTPKELAKMLNVSERTARRFVERLKEQKYPITFCRKTKSYVVREHQAVAEKNMFFEIPVPF